MRKAFTLIELSIVLVIIGLIAGGVVVGRNLINASAVRAQIAQIEKLNTSVLAFSDKYRGIPGDLSVKRAQQYGFFSSPDCDASGAGRRDGNGLIDGYYVPQIYAALMGENILFWSDLSDAGLSEIKPASLNYGYTCGTTVTNSPENYLPEGKIGGTFVHVYEGDGSNWFMLAKITSFDSSSPFSSPTIPVSQAFNIDKKIDDGMPTSGNVNTNYIINQASLTTAPNAATDSASTCYNTTGPAYSLSVNGGGNPNCILSFKFQ